MLSLHSTSVPATWRACLERNHLLQYQTYVILERASFQDDGGNAYGTLFGREAGLQELRGTMRRWANLK